MDKNEITEVLPDHLELVDKVGDGGFGTVYRVVNKKLDQIWALKVFKAHAVSSRSGLSKAIREAKITAMAQHPNVVTIHDADPEHHFIYMEFVDGPPLSNYLDNGISDWKTYQSMASGILAGLAEAHRNGIVHGDLSPGNILLTSGELPKLVDFGFARHVDFSSTSVGMTPGYASPEHVLEKKISTQSDVFSAGVLLYQLATGRHPFDWSHRDAYFYSILEERPVEAQFCFSDAPQGLDTFLYRAMAREQGSRYVSAVEMARAFDEVCSREGRQLTPGTVRTAPSRRAQRHMERGLEYYLGTSREEMDWAEEEFHRALIEDPTLARAYVGLADVEIFRFMSYFERDPRKTLIRAKLHCEKALDIDRNCAEAHRSLGRIHMTQREYDDARTHYDEAIRIDPDYLAAHVARGWCAVESHDLDDAERVATIAHELAEESLEVLLLLSRIHYCKRDYHKAISVAQEASNLHRKSGRAYYDLAMAQRAIGHFKEARANFNRSNDFHGDPNTFIDLGILELYDDNQQDAITALTEAARDGHFAFLAHYYLGLAHHLSGKADDARTCFESSARESDTLADQAQKDPYARSVGSMATAALGDHERSQSQATRALLIDSRDGLVSYHCACARSWSGDKESVNELVDQALALPGGPSKIEVTFDPHFDRDLA